ncbi:amidohydrolase family protein [Cryobacterium sp. BB736]|uniref:amidohydrolase family protein n=1 Tax=Cryobacterium sp. BB736 TaxID=2746963 RepID=UPI00187748E1
MVEGSAEGRSSRNHIAEAGFETIASQSRGQRQRVVFRVDECWAGEWLGPTVLEVDDRGIRRSAATPTAHLPGTVLPGLRDAHVHLGLIDPTALLAAGIGAVDDCGWDPDAARTWAADQHLPEVRFAGAFLTAPGGYPSDRDWAPTASVLEVAGTDDAGAAVQRQLDAGASFIKVTLNAAAGPVLDDAKLCAIVGEAHSRGLGVTAHVEGAGQAERAFRAGVDRFAHAPFTERLSDDLLSAMADNVSWVSTLDIHGWGEPTTAFDIASDNVRHFRDLGGRVVYGTDLGNGPLPVGINHRELSALTEAGFGGDQLVAAIAPARFGRILSHLADDRHADTAAWLAGASAITPDQLLERLAQ